MNSGSLVTQRGLSTYNNFIQRECYPAKEATGTEKCMVRGCSTIQREASEVNLFTMMDSFRVTQPNILEQVQRSIHFIIKTENLMVVLKSFIRMASLNNVAGLWMANVNNNGLHFIPMVC